MIRARLLTAVLAAVLACVAASPAARAASVADGQKAFDRGHFAAALAAWQPLAAQGDPKAELGLGVLFDLGVGVAQDTSTAFGWYRRAGEAGLADAELNVAVMYDSGRGTARDAAAAAEWYARASAHGDHRAEYDLAQLYGSGEGVPRNQAVAEAWLRAAAAGGLDAAGERLSARRAARGAADHGQAGLVGVTLAAPADGAIVQRDPASREVELVWTAPAEPAPCRFYVQVLTVDASATKPVVAKYTQLTSMLVRLQPVHGQYLWRVYVVGAKLRSYLPTGWNRFSVIWRGAVGAG